MVGSALSRALRDRGFTNVIGQSSKILDLTRQADVENFFQAEKPEYVFLAAAKAQWRRRTWDLGAVGRA